ncbi:hypothetical protein CVT25_006043 [Psilocybe cyanescens]|uniref:DOMON domain-containing protein n=1 Tax=Psilocybe cyanescens TaxID=93625 RepID=A0A409VML0_PSICY|nr:hypothetical protein CVT25_006043 [Psilocybe cyanescens]
MLSFVARVALSALLATSALAQTFQINTPILPAGQPSAPALLDLGQQSGNSVTWVANLAVGTSGFLNLRDSTGTLAQSGPFTVQSGTNTSCVGGSIVTSAGPGGGGGGSSATSTPGSSGTSTSTSASKSASKSASTSSPTSAAVSQYAPAGVAAMIGAALLALAV